MAKNELSLIERIANGSMSVDEALNTDEEIDVEFDEAREKFYLEKLGTKTPLFLALNSVDRGLHTFNPYR